MKKIILSALAASVGIMLVGCGPTVYHSEPVVYSQQPVVTYDAVPAPIVIFGGHQGYYDSYHHFHTLVVVNGQSGFYDSTHVFHSQTPAPRVDPYKPNYTGSSTVGRNAASSTTTATTSGMPNYGTGGSISRGVSTRSAASVAAPSVAPASSASAVSAMPNYSSGGSISRGSSTRSYTPSAAPSRPSFSGGISRGGSSRSSRR